MKTSELIDKLQLLKVKNGDLDIKVNVRMTTGKSQRWQIIDCQDAYVCNGNKSVILDALD